MVELHHIYVTLFAGAAVLALVVALVAWGHREAEGALSLAALMLGLAVWSGSYAVTWYVPTLEQQTFWLKATALGSWVIPVGFLTLAFDIARMERWRTPGRIVPIAIVSFALANIEWVNPGRLYDTAFVTHEVGSFTRFAAVPGPLYWAFTTYVFALIVVAFSIIFRVYLRSSGIERTHAALLLIGGLVPFLADIVIEYGSVPLGDLYIAPLTLLAIGIVWLFATLRGTLISILPLARDTLVEQMLDGVIVLDSRNRVVDANAPALDMLHARSADVLGRSAEAVLACARGAAALLDGRGHRHTVLEMHCSDSRSVEFGVTQLVIGARRVPARLVTMHDVTEERRANDGLKLARKVFDTANEGIVVTLPDADERIIDVNDAYCRLTGRSREDTLGQSLSRFRSDKHPPEFFKTIQATLSTEGEWTGEVWQTKADGTAFPSWLSLSVARDDQGHPNCVIGMFTDITQTRQAEEQLRHNATHDALTGLPNRVLLGDRLDRALAHAKRVDGRAAVLFIDLDHFKTINDTLGHAQGDALLVEVASRIGAVLREVDTIGRRGGDEFTVIISDIEDPAQIEATARRVLEAIASLYHLGTADAHVTASIGIAIFPTDGLDATSLIQHADVAMYGAKELGRNRVRFFSEDLQEGLDRRMAVEQELWGADEEERYFLLYQPQVDLSTGRITGVEALARLRSRDSAIVSPAEFIPVAEESELIVKLGEWVLRGACEELARLHEVAPELTMAVNFSARQFREIDVTSLLRDVLETCGVEARFLELEITETAFLVDPQEATAKLEELRDVAGIGLSLDDFGTGYSSFTYVRMFRANTIKIDRSFVELLPDDSEARAIVLSTIALAKGLGATVTAEGPETEEQVRYLRANGCDCAQGYFFSRPIPADEVALLLTRGAFPLPDVEVEAQAANVCRTPAVT